MIKVYVFLVLFGGLFQLGYSQQSAELYFKEAMEKFYTGNDPIGAIKILSDAIQANPRDAQLYHYRATLKNLSKDYKGVIADYDRAIGLPSANADMYFFNRAGAKVLLKDYKGGLLDFSQAISLNAEDASYYIERGKCQQKLKDLPAACVDWKKAQSLGSSEADTLIQEHCK